MTRRSVFASVSLIPFVLALGTWPASADTQPANLGNVANVDRGASAPGPHCHLVLPAGGNGPFDSIIAGAAHQAHTETGLSGGIFQAVPCP